VRDGDTLAVLLTTDEPLYVDGTRTLVRRDTTGRTSATYVWPNISTKAVIDFLKINNHNVFNRN